MNGRVLPSGMAILLALLPALTSPGRADDLTPERRRELAQQAARLTLEAGKLSRAGDDAESVRLQRQALEIRRRLYPAAQYPDGHPNLATALYNLGSMLRRAGKREEALQHFEPALAMYRKLHPPAKAPDGHETVLRALLSTGRVLRELGSLEAAQPHLDEAVAVSRKLYPAAKNPAGHPLLADALYNFGLVLEKLGKHEEALRPLEEAVAIRRRLPPDPLPFDLADNLVLLGSAHLALGRPEAAVLDLEQALAVQRELHPATREPDGHPNIAAVLNNLGAALRAAGKPDAALARMEEALAMKRTLYPAAKYPDGHLELTIALNNVGVALQVLGRDKAAASYYEQNLAMLEKLYPPAKYPAGHPYLAGCLNNLGILLRTLEKYRDALVDCRRAVEMYRRLYPESTHPNGHADLAAGLNNLGLVLTDLGEYDAALPQSEAALAMMRKLYPESRYPGGHHDLMTALISLVELLERMGRDEAALPYSVRAVAMQRQLLNRTLTSAPEADALAYVLAEPAVRDDFLSLTRRQGRADPEPYSAVWTAKAAVMSLLLRRHAAARVALADSGGDHRIRQRWDDLLGTRRRLSQILQQPFDGVAERDRLLADLNERQDRLERELAALLPDLRLRPRADLTPEELGRKLPAGTACVDFLRYTFFEYSPTVKGKNGEKQTSCYLAFLVRPGQTPKRIELGPAGPIDEAIARWRRGIDGRTDGGDASPAATLRRLVWEPIARRLPADVRTLYLSPDGDLARLPFAALPGSKSGTVLLEEFALAVVPSAPWLLEQLTRSADADSATTVLAVGGVDYGAGTAFPPLAATARERQRVLEAFGAPAASGLDGAAATAGEVLHRLPAMRYAHFATHGYFDGEAIRAERKRAAVARTTRPFGDGGPRVGTGARNPLGFVGLAFTGANDPKAGGILTGLDVVGLPLERLRLCVLSACETGLGDQIPVEGVIGLQRAFHVAGCSNVVASLWNVNDAATAALMTKFYHELWTNKREPLAALREAQLTIYRRPDLIPALAGERGAPKLKEAVAVKAFEPSPVEPKDKKRADTKLWAAFVLSGVGK